MFRARPISTTDPRRGVILMVVLALLTLFAILGLSFVIYADAQAKSSQIYRESEDRATADLSPNSLWGFFLNQLIYDAADNGDSVYSALRGHSLARTLYGFNYTLNGNQIVTAINNNGTLLPLNGTPFNGSGRMHGPSPLRASVDDFALVNYQYHLNPANPNLTDPFVRDPERTPRASLSQAPGSYVAGANAPYTYPDANNMFLGAIKADGTVLIQSFHRPFVTDYNGKQVGFGSLDPSNPNWTSNNSALKYMVLRPRPADNDPSFPPPEDAGGDVKNLIGSPGYLQGASDPQPGQYCNNDSIWIDLGFPVMTTSSGRKFKPLFAPLIIDLDGRANLNVHGNVRGTTQGKNPLPTHLSNQGWGPWEVNLSQVLNQNTAGANPYPEWLNLFGGMTTPYEPGRYGQQTIPTSNSAPNVAPPLRPTHFWGQIDYDAATPTQNGPTWTNQLAPPNFRNPPYSLPGQQGPYHGFAMYPSGYQNGSPQALDNTQRERLNHPSLYNFFTPAQRMVGALGGNSFKDRTFDAWNMEALLRAGGTGSQSLLSELFYLLPQNLNNPSDPTGSMRRRNLVTTLSFDFDVPGAMPMVWTRQPGGPDYQAYGLGANAAQQLYPTGNPIPYPLDNNVAAGTAPPTSNNTLDPVSEFGSIPIGPVDWRNGTAALTHPISLVEPPLGKIIGALGGRIDLNRDLPDFPAPVNGAINPNNGQFQTALKARQQFALDIFGTLIAVTGAADPAVAQPGTPEFRALRYLAQLAVNIVDYIDTDNYMTPFAWSPGNPNEWVYGTEMPQLVINEVYTEYRNDKNDPKIKGQKPAKQTAGYYFVDTWVELLNPLLDNSSGLNKTIKEQCIVPLMTSTNPGATPIYRLIVTGSNSNLRVASNVTGAPDPNAVQQTPKGTGQPNPQQPTVVKNWSLNPLVPPVVTPANGAYTGVNGGNQGFYLVGPSQAQFPVKSNLPTPNKPPQATLQSPNMEFQYPVTGPPPNVSVLLQRLACPNLPFNDPKLIKPGSDPTDSSLPTYNPALPANPYITVDYVENLQCMKDITVDAAGQVKPAIDQTKLYSYAKREPYGSAASQWAGYNPQTNQAPNPPAPNWPQNTFYRHNGLESNNPNPGTPGQVLQIPFHWLTHLDRQLVSPMELLQVTGYKPHELTQQFFAIPAKQGGGPNPKGTPQPYQHRAPWFDQGSRLFRFFEFAETRGHGSGVGIGGRAPGLININSIWDPETFLALLDPNPNAQNATDLNNTNCYTAQDLVGNYNYPTTPPGGLFQQMISSRSPNGAPGANDLPFVSFGAAISGTGQKSPYAQGMGISNTLLRMSGAAVGQQDQITKPRLFQLTPQGGGDPRNHPYVKDQVLAKLFNNVTTRSNVFAVWVTVGFFEVVDDTVYPPKLGAEIGKAENRNIRHRMFAIVDRSNLSINLSANQPVQGPGQKPVFLQGVYQPTPPATSGPTPAGKPVNILLPAATPTMIGGRHALAGTYDGVPWAFRAGDTVMIDTGGYAEMAQVANLINPTGTTPGGFTVGGVPNSPPLTKAHPGPFFTVIPQTSLKLLPGSGGYQVVQWGQAQQQIPPQVPGNPGPQPQYDPSQDPVVRYLSAID
jgi:hypothetical protein